MRKLLRVLVLAGGVFALLLGPRFVSSPAGRSGAGIAPSDSCPSSLLTPMPTDRTLASTSGFLAASFRSVASPALVILRTQTIPTRQLPRILRVTHVRSDLRQTAAPIRSIPGTASSRRTVSSYGSRYLSIRRSS